jgi:hypothetical protein
MTGKYWNFSLNFFKISITKQIKIFVLFILEL